jgi:hypothetical protein
MKSCHRAEKVRNLDTGHRQAFYLRIVSILAALALVALAGGTTAFAAPTSSGELTWHAFKLLNGWKSASKPQLVTGTPSWALHDGVIYLRGAVTQPTASGSDSFAKLPSFARPAHNLYLQAYTTAAVPGTVFIGANGNLQAFNGEASAFTSLAGISFATVAIKSHKLALKNNWVSSQSRFDTGDPAYGVSGGIVYLSGSLTGGKDFVRAFVLPKGARPSHQLFISVYTFDGATGYLDILPDGIVSIGGTDASSFTSLASVSFPVAATKWHSFKLQDDWKSGQASSNSGAPAYAIINGVVYLTGAMLQTTGDAGRWTTLPTAVRTAKDALDFEVYTVNGTAGGITVTGRRGLVSETPFSNAHDFTSLAGVAYPQSS